MIATPQPISSSRNCLLAAEPETFLALPRPASTATSVNVTPMDSLAPSRLCRLFQRNGAAMERNHARRDRRSIMSLLEPVPPLLLQLIRLPIQSRESVNGFAAVVQPAQFPVNGREHIEISRRALVD